MIYVAYWFTTTTGTDRREGLEGIDSETFKCSRNAAVLKGLHFVLHVKTGLIFTVNEPPYIF